MSRTIVQTKTPGWYVDAADRSKKVRKQPGDTILTLEQYNEQVRNGTEPESQEGNTERTLTQERAAKAAKASHEAKASRKATNGKPKGKVSVAQRVTITCKWRGPNNDQPQCGKTREVKPQDVFQVKYCVEHQAENIKRQRRERAKAKRVEAKKAAKAAA